MTFKTPGNGVRSMLEDSQGFINYIEREFKNNLELAQEEIENTAPDAYDLAQGYVSEPSERSAWNMAVEWTQDDIANFIGSHFENKWWQKQDDINRTHFD